MFRSSCFLLLLTTLCSCDYINNAWLKRSNTKQTDAIVDFTQVDSYPVFPSCRNLIENDALAKCFADEIYNYFSDALLQNTYEVPECTNETIMVRLLVDQSGKVFLYDIEQSAWADENLDMIEDIIEASIAELPQLVAATKHSIPVATVFELPLVLKLK